MLKAIIFGAGGTGQLVYNRVCKDFDVIAFCDNNVEKQGTLVFNIPVIAPTELTEIIFDKIIIGTDMRESVYKQVVQQMGISADKLIDEPLKLAAYTTRRVALMNARDIIESCGLSGNVAEAGVFQGEFAKKINEAFSDRNLYLFDTFEGFDKRDIALENKKVGALEKELGVDTTLDSILNIMPFKDKCIIKQGYFPETAKNIDDDFVFVSLDMDLYKPTLEGLRFFYPRLVKGGYIFLHDFFTTRYSGVKQAVNEFKLECDIHISPIGDDCSIAITK